MQLDELIATLPNGLHDSHVSKVELDYVARTLKLDLQVWVGSIELPDPGYDYANADPLWIDVCDLPAVVPAVPADAFGF